MNQPARLPLPHRSIFVARHGAAQAQARLIPQRRHAHVPCHGTLVVERAHRHAHEVTIIQGVCHTAAAARDCCTRVLRHPMDSPERGRSQREQVEGMPEEIIGCDIRRRQAAAIENPAPIQPEALSAGGADVGIAGAAARGPMHVRARPPHGARAVALHRDRISE